MNLFDPYLAWYYFYNMTIFPSCFRRQLWYPPRASNLKVEQKFSSKFHFPFLWFCVWKLLELKDLVRPPIPWTWSETLRKFICFKILSEFLFPRFSLTIITHPQLRPKSGHAQVRLVVQHRHLKHSRVCFLLYTVNFYSVNFNTMKMKIDTESKSESKLQFDCHHVSNGLLLPWRAQYKKSKPEDRSCTQPGQYHPGRQVDGDHDIKDVNVKTSNMMTTVDGVGW